MSGDLEYREQPVIFYTKEMTESKLSLLEYHGIIFKSTKYYLKRGENSVES
jgi:hypothetical protein